MSEIKHPPWDATTTWSISADWVFPVDSPPLRHGTVTIRGERIVAVEAGGTRRADVVLDRPAALVPGFVNIHAHLDLSGLRGEVPPTPDIVDWLRQIVSHRGQTSPDAIRRAFRSGLGEAMRTGTVLLSDITDSPECIHLFDEQPMHFVEFLELRGLSAERAEIFRQRADAEIRRPMGRLGQWGLSPHAPYSTNKELYHWARQQGVILTTHFLESREELELLTKRTGPFVEFLKELNLWNPEALMDSPSSLASMWDDVRCILAHCNYWQPEIPLPRRATVAYCPRTHAAFGHPPHPFRAMIAQGIPVALGTDSLASNPDLDLLAEARWVHDKHPDFPGEELLRMITLRGAQALGCDSQWGTLESGKIASMVAIPLHETDAPDPHELLWRSSEPAAHVWIAGQQIR